MTFTDPPSPPLASPSAIESADVVLLAGPPAARVAPVARPALPDFAVAVPPLAPCPPVATTVVMLVAAPVSPDVAMERLLAPVFAVESASPLAVASPVDPESPEVERRPFVSPVAPEEPDAAVGLEPAEDDAGPVSPVLVADDWALTSPELPERAVGTTVTSTLPPRPPLASALAMDSPPIVRVLEEPPIPAVTFETRPPWPEEAWAVPPWPPLPPTARTLTTLVAAPVLRDTAVD